MEIADIIQKAQETCDAKLKEGKAIQQKIDERENDFRSLYDFDRFDMQFYPDAVLLYSKMDRLPLNQTFTTQGSPVKK